MLVELLIYGASTKNKFVYFEWKPTFLKFKSGYFFYLLKLSFLREIIKGNNNNLF